MKRHEDQGRLCVLAVIIFSLFALLASVAEAAEEEYTNIPSAVLVATTMQAHYCKDVMQEANEPLAVGFFDYTVSSMFNELKERGDLPKDYKQARAVADALGFVADERVCWDVAINAKILVGDPV